MADSSSLQGEVNLMERHDCDTCLSAGSVNQWGICEICGELFDQAVSFGDWSMISFTSIGEQGQVVNSTATSDDVTEVGRTAA